MTENTICLSRIRSNYNGFSKKEKIIADFILKNPHKVIHWTINQLAEKLSVAESTIFIFCKNIGYKGFQALKIALAADVSSHKDDIDNKIKNNDGIKEITEKIFKSNIKTLEDTVNIQNEEAIHDATEMILNAEQIHFFGVGGSFSVALDAYHKFIRCGINVKIDLDSHLQIMSASLMTNKNVAIVISHSGATKDILDIIQVLKKNKVKVISITNFATSSLSIEADIPLYTVSDETHFRWDALSSRIAQLSILDTLYTVLMIKNKSQSLNSRNKIRDSIGYKRL